MRATGADSGGGAAGDGGAEPLPPSFFARPAEIVAPALLGRRLVSTTDGVRVAGRIVETEAYRGADDPASHAWREIGRTARNDPLFGPPGTAYIHLNYGIHWCLNAVTLAEGSAHGVLIRAVEPEAGLEAMRARRGRDELTSGPARLTQAFGVGPELQRHPLDRPPLWIEPGEPVPGSRVVVTPRIGIRKAAAAPLRFYDDASRWVSRR